MTSDYVVVPREATEEMLHSARPMPLDQLDGIWQAMVSAAPSPWKPISDEAKTGQRVLLARELPSSGWLMAVGHWGRLAAASTWIISATGNVSGLEPTHFMLLPAPPSNPT